MWINRLTVKNCRILEEVELDLSPKFNIILGENASGKTSLLEALSVLSKGRSFRTSHILDLITHGQQSVIVSALVSGNDSQQRVGIEKNPKKTKIRINQKDIYSQAELSLNIPVTVVHPASIDLITGPPKSRRSYLDWLAFYLFDDFHIQWKQYQHILQQRNICLKDKQHRYALKRWTQELIKLHPVVSEYRKTVLEILQPKLELVTKFLLPELNIKLLFQNGLPNEITLESNDLLKFYKEKEENDLKRKRTSYGAHRANMKISIENKPALEIASRGQLKLLAISLLLAQSNTIKENTKNPGILLIDDLAAELDKENKKRLINYISQLNQQVLITSTHDMEVKNQEAKMFHVKHGKIAEYSL